MRIELKKWLENKDFLKISKSPQRTKTPYRNLAPVDNYEKIEPYEEMLLAALQDTDVKNIAIAGAYGAGKSSIIKTFQKRNPTYKNKTINISLASFCLHDKKDGNNDDSNALQRQLELSILQQLFYHIHPSEIPYSRFKRIRNISTRTIVFTILECLIITLAILLFMPVRFLHGVENIQNNLWVVIVIQIIASVIFLFLCVNLIRFCSKLNCLKINIPNVELEISKNDASSILNRHMDEIIYYFEVSTKEIIIFEDLDRFDNIDIFQKLREINLILNNAEQIERHIIFIYALRDDVFKDENRTKFFDYMIPVVPIVNISNSGDKLIKFFEENDTPPTPKKEFLSSISVFIDNMRLLISICNEFTLYQKILSSGKLISENLFGMILYKNLYPDDFVTLHSNRGTLANIFQQKHEYINNANDKLDQKIKELTEEQIQLEEEFLKNEIELRELYLYQIAKENKYEIEILLENAQKWHNIFECTQDELWKELYNNKNKQLQLRIYSAGKNRGYGSEQRSFLFSELEKYLGSYETRSKKIFQTRDENKKYLQSQITNFKKEKIDLKTITIAKLLSSHQLTLDNNIDSKKRSVIGFLLGNGYIDENYHTYISFFHEGSLTQSDNDFVMAVIGLNPRPFDYSLTNLQAIVDKLSVQYFHNPEILNFDLLTYLLSDSSSLRREKRNEVISQISTLSDKIRKFIDGYIDYSKSESDTLLAEICKRRPDLWDVIESQSGYTEKQKEKYLSILLDKCRQYLEGLNGSGQLKTHLLNMDHFFQFADEFSIADACINAISELDIQFAKLDNPQGDNARQIFEYIYSNNAYSFTLSMLSLVFHVKQGEQFVESTFQKANYTYIKESGLKELISYVDSNILTYLDQITSHLEVQEDSPNMVLSIINNSSIDITKRIEYLAHQASKIREIQLIKEKDMRKAVISKNLVISSWNNVFSYLLSNSDTLTPELISFLNIPENYEKLGEETFKLQPQITTHENAKKIFSIIMKADVITETAITELQKACPFTWLLFGLEDLPEKRVATLLRSKKFALTAENYSGFKVKVTNGHIGLIEQCNFTFLERYKTLPIDDTDWVLILKSSLDDEIKKSLLEQEHKKISETKSLAKASCPIVEKYWRNYWGIDILIACLPWMGADIALKTGIYHLRKRNFDRKNSMMIIARLPEPYCKLAISGTRPILPKNSDTEFLLDHINDWNIISHRDDSDRKVVKVCMKRF